MQRAILVIAVIGALVPVRAQGPVVTPPPPFPNPCPTAVLSNASLPWDNTRGNFVNHEVGLVRPLATQGPILVAVNQPGAQFLITWLNRLETETPAGFRHDSVLKGGPGMASLAFRPGTWHVWVVDRVTGSVGVFDLIRRSLVRTIAVGPEPHDLVFADDGTRAWVTCSGDDTLAVIDLRPTSPTLHQVVQRIPIPARQPRALTKVGNRLYIAAFQSGNNTGPRSLGGRVEDADIAPVTPGFGASNPLPDRDIHVVNIHPTDPLLDTLDPNRTVRSVGTTLFNIHHRPGTSHLWVPNTEALNATAVGEKNFVDGTVVQNRISVVNTDTGGVSFIDLDALAPPGVSFAQPTSVTFDQVRQRAYVTCYGGDVVAVLNYAGGLVGVIRMTSLGPWRAGPRASVLAGDTLLVFNKNDNSITRVPLGSPLSNSTIAASPFPAGYDPTPRALRRGRGHLINGSFSASGTSSCASCHTDGHSDGLVWDLGSFLDPVGTPNPTFGRDDKGPTTTQSLRGLREAPPYHWRGEKPDLDSFNGAFVDLLKRPAGPLSATAMAELTAYMESLVYPANPRQDRFRDYRPDELAGAQAFLTNPAGNCAACHALPLGSQSELMVDIFAGPSRSFKVTQLRGVGDKVLRPVLSVGGPFGRNGFLNEGGAGLLHTGNIPSVFDFVDHFFQMDACAETQISSFLQAFDTGLAPSTARQATLHQGNALTFTELFEFTASADRGDCDLYVIGTLQLGGPPLHIDGWYVPGTGEIETQYASLGRFPLSALPSYAAAGLGEWTFVGAPLGTGWRYGVDLDLDGLRDLDEAGFGLSPETPDQDGDGFLDGHEVLHGTDPHVPDLVSPDSQSPQILAADVVYTTTQVAKLHVRTDEMTTVSATVGAGATGSVTRPSPDLGFDTSHTLILQGLPPGQGSPVTVTARDQAGNTASVLVPVSTLNRVFSGASHVSQMSLSVGPSATSPSGLALLGTATVRARSGVPLAAQTVHAAISLELNGVLQSISFDAQELTNSQGVATWTIDLPSVVLLAPQRVAHLSVFWIDGEISPPGAFVENYVEAEDILNFLSHTF